MGRKPVLLIGLSGVVICTVLFGLSRSFVFAVATRAAAGALSGNTMIINSAVGDITDETNQAQAYAWIGLAYNIASILGPAIGYVNYCVSWGLYRYILTGDSLLLVVHLQDQRRPSRKASAP